MEAYAFMREKDNTHVYDFENYKQAINLIKITSRENAIS